EGGDGLGQAAAPRHALRAVDAVAVAVLGHAHDDVADEGLVDLAALERRRDGEATELRGREAGEEPRLLVVDEDVGARRAAGAFDDDDGSDGRHVDGSCHSWRNAAGTRGPFWTKFFIPMSMSTVDLQRAKPCASTTRPSASGFTRPRRRTST